MRDRLFLSGKYFRHCSTCDEKKKIISDPYSLIHLLFSHNARFFSLVYEVHRLFFNSACSQLCNSIRDGSRGGGGGGGGSLVGFQPLQWIFEVRKKKVNLGMRHFFLLPHHPPNKKIPYRPPAM